MQGYREARESYFVQNVTAKKAINDRYIRTNNYNNKQEFNDAAQKEKIRVVLDGLYAYMQNQDITSAAQSMETRSKRTVWYLHSSQIYSGDVEWIQQANRKNKNKM